MLLSIETFLITIGNIFSFTFLALDKISDLPKN